MKIFISFVNEYLHGASSCEEKMCKSLSNFTRDSVTWQEVDSLDEVRSPTDVYLWIAGSYENPAIASAHLSYESAFSWIKENPRKDSGYNRDVLTLVKLQIDDIEGNQAPQSIKVAL